MCNSCSIFGTANLYQASNPGDGVMLSNKPASQHPHLLGDKGYCREIQRPDNAGYWGNSIL